MLKEWMRWGVGALAAAAMVAGSHSTALALSDNSSDTWAGDVNSIALPEGTFIAIDYFGYRHGDQYVTSPNNIFSKLTGGKSTIPSNAELLTDITRLVYFTSLFGRPLVLEAALPFVDVNKINIGNFPAPIGGLGPQTVADGFTDPVFFASYGLIVQPKMERFLALTNYFYVPIGRDYDKFSQVNVSTPGQFTWVPQLSYAEGLAKFSPALKGFWIDVIANASIHTDGGSPFALAPGIQFDKLTQQNSYDLKAFLRYDFVQLGHVAVGIEKSWGGDQIASGGLLQGVFGGPTSFGKDDFLKGHVQITYPLMRDLQVGADFTHDFEREGGIREDFTAELRVTKFFIPTQEPLK